MAEQEKMPQPVRLFREEAMRFHAQRLHGTVRIITPLRWHLIGALMLLVLIAAGALLVFATYAKVETVQGIVTLDKGTANIVATRVGVVENVAVRDGQKVRFGEKLASVRVEEEQDAGVRISKSLEEQSAQLAAQQASLSAASQAEVYQARAKIAGGQAVVASLELQIADQKKLIDAAAKSYQVATDLADRGFVSKIDLEERRTLLIHRRQQMEELRQALSVKRSEIAELQWAVSQSESSGQAAAASAHSSRSAVSQQSVLAELARGYSLTAPVDGVVTALAVRAGQAVDARQTLMIVVPERATTQVELFVSSEAIGFVSPGDEVRLSLDAYPYQTFGTLPSRVVSVSQAPAVYSGSGDKRPQYLVIATMPQPWIEAFGRQRRVLPGMTLSARIVTGKRSLIEWLFEPLVAVRKR